MRVASVAGVPPRGPICYQFLCTEDSMLLGDSLLGDDAGTVPLWGALQRAAEGTS